MELYFLRSTEQKIASDMLRYAYGLDIVEKTVKDFPALEIYTRHYGLSSKDLGLYALKEHKIAGAAWIRILSEHSDADAYIDSDTPILNIAVKPEFRNIGIGSAMLQQLLLEASALYKQISVRVKKETSAVKFYENFGFVRVEDSDSKSPIDGSDVFTMIKKLEYKKVERPSDGYDSAKWMD